MPTESVWEDTRTFFPLFLAQIEQRGARSVCVVGASDGKFVLPLARRGIQVLAIERDPALVQKWAGTLTHVVEADATNIDALRQLGAQDFSSAVVGVGTSID